MFEKFLTNKNSWVNQGSPSLEVVFSSRLRLARNLTGFAFPSRLSKSGAEAILDKFKQSNSFLPEEKDLIFVKMSELDKLDREFLLERHLISRQFFSSKQAALVVSSDERISAMINEEDHLRLQVIEAGYDFKNGWEKLDRIDDALAKRFSYAFLPDLGYLTSCPTNIGTGLRASCMMHLPGLILTKRIEKVLEFLAKVSFAIRGLFGEGSQASGNFFQISNQISLGVSEEEVIDNLSGIVKQIRRHELDSRQILLDKFKLKLEDTVWRALGIVKNCRLISCQETLKYLSALSLGIDLGIIKGIKKEVFNNLFIAVQPAHIQKLEGKVLSQKKRDYLRAELLREKLN